jgi:hypothetical protein
MINLLAGIALSKGCGMQQALMSVLTIWGFFDTLKRADKLSAL